MSDIHKRIITGTIGSIVLILLLQLYSFQLLLIFSVLYLTSQEYYEIVNKAYHKHLNSELISSLSKSSFGVFIIPLFSFIGTLFSYQETGLPLYLILSVVVCIVTRLYQYSCFCNFTNSQNSAKPLLFTTFVVIMGDILFCVFICFPFSYSICNLQ